MPNIWAFALQTATVTVSALLLLLVKRLLEDKLSPRWQYGIWALLAARCLLPATIRRDVLLPLGLWLETRKSAAEAALSSRFSAVYEPISLSHVLPQISGTPHSITDWLLVLYAAGAAALAVYYLLSYGLLRLQLRRGQDASPETLDSMDRVCRKYGLKSCSVVAVPGLESAFVSGIFRPVLAVPAGENVNEKVILHELLHLKYWDIPQNIFWALLRCLHWCNPILHYIFHRIGNDMESLCDQRVLERLEGEERRQYGGILLSMASRRYARSPGTGSISNGSRNIARRIAAIARFKKYPRGMALVSMCIALVLILPLLIGSAAAVDSDLFWPEDPSHQQRAMAAARVQRCSTVAGAIDTYAKGILKNNGFYIAIASPVSAQQELLRQIPDNWHWDGSEGAEYLSSESEYSVYDLVQNADGSYNAYIAFPVSDFDGSTDADWPTTNEGVPYISGTLVVPLHLFRENDTWVATEAGERIKAHIRYDQLRFYGDDMPWLAEETVTGKTGTVTVSHRGVYAVDNAVSTNNLFGWISFDSSIKPDAQFSYGQLSNQIAYTCTLPDDQLPTDKAGLRVWELGSMEELESLNTTGELPQLEQQYSSVSSSCSDGSSYTQEWVNGTWDRKLEEGSGVGFGSSAIYPDQLPALPAGYLIQILFDDVVVDEIVIEVNDND